MTALGWGGGQAWSTQEDSSIITTDWQCTEPNCKDPTTCQWHRALLQRERRRWDGQRTSHTWSTNQCHNQSHNVPAAAELNKQTSCSTKLFNITLTASLPTAHQKVWRHGALTKNVLSSTWPLPPQPMRPTSLCESPSLTHSQIVPYWEPHCASSLSAASSAVSCLSVFSPSIMAWSFSLSRRQWMGRGTKHEVTSQALTHPFHPTPCTQTTQSHAWSYEYIHTKPPALKVTIYYTQKHTHTI